LKYLFRISISIINSILVYGDVLKLRLSQIIKNKNYSITDFHKGMVVEYMDKDYQIHMGMIISVLHKRKIIHIKKLYHNPDKVKLDKIMNIIGDDVK